MKHDLIENLIVLQLARDRVSFNIIKNENKTLIKLQRHIQIYINGNCLITNEIEINKNNTRFNTKILDNKKVHLIWKERKEYY